MTPKIVLSVLHEHLRPHAHVIAAYRASFLSAATASCGLILTLGFGTGTHRDGGCLCDPTGDQGKLPFEIPDDVDLNGADPFSAGARRGRFALG